MSAGEGWKGFGDGRSFEAAAGTPLYSCGGPEDWVVE